MSDSEKQIYEFGPYRVDAHERVLLCNGRPVALTPKAFGLLLVLLKQHGHIVEKDVLINQVWSDSFVEEGNLKVTVSMLRKALEQGDSGEPEYIETVPRRGYRFKAAVRQLEGGAADLVLHERTRTSILVQERHLGETTAGESIGDMVAAESSPIARITLPGHEPSRAESLIIWIKKHKAAVAFGLAVLILAGAATLYFTYHASRSSSTLTSIAVLPFANAGGDQNQDYLSDGFSESIINSLSQLSRMKVLARATVFRYKGREAEPQKVGRELGVDVLLTGKVSQQGDNLIVQADLVRVSDGTQIWGERYNRKSSDIFAVQEQIARKISENLNWQLSDEEQRRVTKRYTENVAAYQLYLNGRYFWNQRTAEGLKKSVEYFQQAIGNDQNYALAYSGIADSYMTLGYFSYIAPGDAFPKAKEAAQKALALDANLAEAHTSLAYAKLYYDWDWPEAENEFKRAIAINGNYAIAHHWYSVYLTARGRPDEALVEIKRAQELDPMSLVINTDMGFELYYDQKYDQAIQQLKSTLEKNKEFPLAHLWLGRAYEKRGMYDQAISEFKQTELGFPRWPVAIAATGYDYGISGKKNEARRVLEELNRLSKEEYVTPYGVALVYAGLGDKDQAFRSLNQAYDQRSHWLVWLRLDPRWDGLRSDPRFQDIAQRVGLAQ